MVVIVSLSSKHPLLKCLCFIAPLFCSFLLLVLQTICVSLFFLFSFGNSISSHPIIVEMNIDIPLFNLEMLHANAMHDSLINVGFIYLFIFSNGISLVSFYSTNLLICSSVLESPIMIFTSINLTAFA